VRANDVTPERLRDLAEWRPPAGKVLSLFLDLDPSRFGTIPARSSAVTALLDAARHAIDDKTLPHQERTDLRADLDRVRDVLDPAGLPADGAAALAVFASRPGDLLEVLRLPRPVPSRAVVGEAPDVAPLVGLEERRRWCVALVSHGTTRVFLGPGHAIVVADEAHLGEFDREDEHEAERHLREVGARLLATLKAGRWERLLVGGPHERQAPFCELLNGEVRSRLAGCFDADVDGMTREQVSERVVEADERLDREELAALLERFRAGAVLQTAVAGEADTHLMLEERRVEALLLADGHEDDEAVRQAVLQRAKVYRVDPEEAGMGRHRIGAVLRF
jgi:hypothetical protein